MRTTDQANRQYFRQAYTTGEHGWSVEQASPYVVEYLTQVKRARSGGRLLDVGCGEGRHAVAAFRLGFRVVAVDYEPLALRRARKFAADSGARNITFRKAEALSLPLRPASFDVVLDYGCLHHQRKADWVRYRKSILHVLKPGGYFLLSTFSRRFRLFAGSRRRWHIAHGAYRRYFTPDDFRELFGGDFDILDRKEERGKGRGLWHVLMRRRMRPRR